ncbi:hypothetical protein BDA96_07G145300 [Sorghum bicolor]|uniref:Uncharacterized protein n=2 Tax=Sorghum bicolor TaxID=4558 RepID=A0A921QMT8_SORBI|nr:hypothetical protein BDA96_07G145300 [Sorghum bicolor]KXG25199.1 hypothetical protein SORBI_3007G135100 [Sorghum bicolor]
MAHGPRLTENSQRINKRIVDHRAHHLFDETLPRTTDVLDRSTRATGQPLAAARCVLIRELHLVACLCALPLPAGCHAAVEMTLADAWFCIWGQQARGGNCITCDKLVGPWCADDFTASYAVAASSLLPPFAKLVGIR